MSKDVLGRQMKGGVRLAALPHPATPVVRQLKSTPTLQRAWFALKAPSRCLAKCYSHEVSQAKWRKGMEVDVLLEGAGYITRERKTVLKVTKRGVYLDNGEGNDPSGPFDLSSGHYLNGELSGFREHIEVVAPPAAEVTL